MSLIDPLGRRISYLRVSVTDRCDLRCRYCRPPDPVPPRPREEILSFEEIARIVGVAADLGVRKVRVTGGEPLLRRGVAGLVERLGRIPGIETTALTTNGTLLAREAARLRSAGLDRLNISLDTLRRERFREITGRDRLPEVLAGLRAALDAGFAPVQLNVVVMRGVNDDELEAFADLARERPLAVRFIEFMPLLRAAPDGGLLVPAAEVRARLAARLSLRPRAGGEGDRAVAREFKVDGFAGTIGFISPMTEGFCASCDRLRLAADGTVRACLFGPPTADLRPAVRSGGGAEAIEEALRAAARGKPAARGARFAGRMTEIGG